MHKVVIAAMILVLTAIPGLVLGDESYVGNPSFKERSSSTMKLRYGFNGASVFDKSKNAWVYIPMTPITRNRVDGYVNQVNDKFALAAGLHSVAVYDYSKHRWVERKPAPIDDSSGDLKTNFQFSDTSVKVKTLNGPSITYTTAGGWR